MRTQAVWVPYWTGTELRQEGVENCGLFGQVGCTYRTACAGLAFSKGTVCTGTWVDGSVMPGCFARAVYVRSVNGRHGLEAGGLSLVVHEHESAWGMGAWDMGG